MAMGAFCSQRAVPCAGVWPWSPPLLAVSPSDAPQPVPPVTSDGNRPWVFHSRAVTNYRKAIGFLFYRFARGSARSQARGSAREKREEEPVDNFRQNSRGAVIWCLGATGGGLCRRVMPR